MVNPQKSKLEQSTAAIPSPVVDVELLKSKYVSFTPAPIKVRLLISASGIVLVKLYIPGPNEIVFPFGSSVKKIMNSSSTKVPSSNEIIVTSSGATNSSSLSSHEGTIIIDRMKNNCNNLAKFMFISP